MLSESQIHRGDLLEVTISDLVGESQFYPLPVRVLEDGTIRLPLAGQVSVAGLTFPQAEQVIFASYSSQGLLKKPLVTVALRDTRKVRIYVLGAVNKPGQYDLNASDSDLLSALVAAGGLTSDANPVIEVRRRVLGDPHRGPGHPAEQAVVQTSSEVTEPSPVVAANPVPAAVEAPPASTSSYSPIHYPPVGKPAPSLPAEPRPHAWTLSLASSEHAPVEQAAADQALTAHTQPETAPPPLNPSMTINQVVRLDLTNEAAKQKLAQGFYLQNGDTITIEDRKSKPIYVVGLVNKPGEYPLPVDRDLRVLEAIGLAGGVDRGSLPNRVLVVRQRPDGSGVIAVRIDLDKAKRDNAENIRVMQGDTVSVEETAGSFTRGLLRNAIRLGIGATVTPSYGF
jgi:polysaccharide export outer membrane protein